MENAIQEIAQGNLFLLLGFTLAGYIIIRLLRKYLPLLMRKERAKRITRVSLPVLEIIFWIWVFYEAIPAFYQRNTLLGILIFAVALSMIAWFAWYRLRDFIAGFMFQTGMELKEGEIIEIEGTVGKVTRFRGRHLELTTIQGETVLLPYTSIAGKKVVKQHSTEQTQSFRFTLSANGSTEPHQQSAAIKQFILRQPWSSLSKDPQVHYTHTDEEKNIYEITVFTPDNSHAEKIREELEGRF